MSDAIHHECAISLVRLLKPLDYYVEKYGTALYGLQRMQILIQKMRNRGQDGAGLATVKLDPPVGTRYISRYRTAKQNYIEDLFEHIFNHFDGVDSDMLSDSEWLKANKPYTGEVIMGHLRYGTYGLKTIETCHPFLRQNNWISRNLILAGNFNMTNVDELFDELIDLGQYPKEKSDTVTVLEKIGHFLDDEVEKLFRWYKSDGYSNRDITQKIIESLDPLRIIQKSMRKMDGGYVISGIIGHGDAFMIRDPHGIRPCFYYADDEIIVAASERPAIQTALDVRHGTIKELSPGHTLIIRKNGQWEELPYTDPAPVKQCSFERIYFSRGTDRDIYKERKHLGKNLAKQVLEAVDYDLDNTVFSFIPNTAESSFYGMMEQIEEEFLTVSKEKILAEGGELTREKLDEILSHKPRAEKMVVKDAKIRTFIADDASRSEMVPLSYDVTYGIVNRNLDNLVLVDDSIVRGTTLRESILRIVDRLGPKNIIVVSSAPQIRYPDCYGIDMSQIGKFVAFQAMIELLRDNNLEDKLENVYELCLKQMDLPKEEVVNHVKSLYDHFTYEEISNKIAEILTHKNLSANVKVIYQTIEGLHDAIPHHKGDWYFTGDYPTPGGNKVVNKAFVYYMQGVNLRAY